MAGWCVREEGWSASLIIESCLRYDRCDHCMDMERVGAVSEKMYVCVCACVCVCVCVLHGCVCLCLHVSICVPGVTDRLFRSILGLQSLFGDTGATSLLEQELLLGLVWLLSLRVCLLYTVYCPAVQ